MIEMTGETGRRLTSSPAGFRLLNFGVQGHRRSDQTQHSGFLLPCSADKWRQLSRFRSSLDISTLQICVCSTHVSCLIVDYFVFFLWYPHEHTTSLFRLFKILPRESKAIVNLWAVDVSLFYIHYHLCSCYGQIWKRTGCLLCWVRTCREKALLHQWSLIRLCCD